jgi:hypothetical protein
MKTQNMIEMLETATPVLEALSTLFVFLIGLLVLFIIIVFIFDISQPCSSRTPYLAVPI